VESRDRLAGALALLFTVQFVWQARQAQIDATLCFLDDAQLVRLVASPAAGAFVALVHDRLGCSGTRRDHEGRRLSAAARADAVCDSAQREMAAAQGSGWRSALAPRSARVLAAVSIWLVPMLLAASKDPSLAAYRDEILFNQTVKRYGNAWHHREPFWYFLVDVIPGLWLPLTLLVPWLFSHWRNALRSFDLRIALLASWIVLVVLFFSISAGKRGVYVLPAVPAFALLCAPYLQEIASRRSAQRAMFVLASLLGALCVLHCCS
jgi:4-amino-4-deoxy-L-arabinose transferase-like glycosyltransferase